MVRATRKKRKSTAQTKPSSAQPQSGKKGKAKVQVLKGRRSINTEGDAKETLFAKEEEDWGFGEFSDEDEEANVLKSSATRRQTNSKSKKKSKAKPNKIEFSSSDDEDEDEAELLEAPGFESSSDEEEADVMDEDESESDDDNAHTHDIEADAKRLEKRRRRAEMESQRELEEMGAAADEDQQSQAEEGGEETIDLFRLPATLQTQATDLAGLRTRMHEIVRVLSRFGELREPGRPRADYVQQLTVDVCNYYGYAPFLADLFMSLFPVGEALEFFEANERPRPVTLRTNTLKTKRGALAKALIGRGVNLDPVEWSSEGLQVFENQVPLGGTPEYLAGHYMLQTAASWLPVMALDPQPNERILDMCSAPGGKSTHIAARMKNSGQLFANDSQKERMTGLIANVHRLGVRNCVACNYDARKLKKLLSGFDRVLLDAPCAGLGVVTRDPSVKTQRGQDDVRKLAHLQKELILSAIDLLRPQRGKLDTGGVLVYSTCSLSVEENEAVVNYALSRRHVKLVDASLPFGRAGFTRFRAYKFHPSVAHSRRFYPHLHNTDGFFVAKFVKLENGPKVVSQSVQQNELQQSQRSMSKVEAKPVTPTKPMTLGKKRSRKVEDQRNTKTSAPKINKKRPVKQKKARTQKKK